MDSHATTRQPLQQYQQQQHQQLKRPAPQPPPANNKKSTTGAASGDASAAADDLHAWSLFRQNLNANFSESALAINGGGGNGGGNNHHHQNNHQNHNHHHYRSSSPNEPLPNGGYHQNRSSNNGGIPPNSASNFQLRESTVNNILSHPKYGAQLKNQDAFTYLRFGLPRVKVTSSLNSTANNNKATAAQPDPPIIDHQPTRRNFGGNNNNIGNNNNSSQNNHQQQKSLNESSYQSSRQPPLPPPPQTQQQLNEELKRRFWSSESNLRAAGAGVSGDHRSSDFDSSGQYSDSSGREMLPTGGPRGGGGGGGGGVPRSSGVPANHHGRSAGNRGAAKATTQQPTSRSQRDPMKPSYSINDLRYSGVNNKGHHNRGDFNGDYDGGRPSSGDGSSSVDHHEAPPAHHSHQRPRSRASPSHFDHPLNRGGGGGGGGRGVFPDDDIRLDEMMVNGATGNGGPFHSSSHSLPPPLAKHPHLVVKDLLYEVDKSPVWRRLCGFSRQKLRVLEDVSFDVRGGELMAIMATSGKSFD